MNLEKEYLKENKTRLNIAHTFTVCAIVICLFYSISVSSRVISTDSNYLLITPFDEAVQISEDEISKRAQAVIELKRFADEFEYIGDEIKEFSVELKDEFKGLKNELKDINLEIKTILSNFSGE